MILQSNTAGLQMLRERIDLAISALPDLLSEAAQTFGETVVEELSSAAPKGKGEGGGTPPEGDASGPLADSFNVQPQVIATTGISIETTQPSKLKFVRYGTGIHGPLRERIYPKVKKALFWPDAPHPFRSVAGQEANDFVSSIIDAAQGKAEEVLQPVIDEIAGMLEA